MIEDFKDSWGGGKICVKNLSALPWGWALTEGKHLGAKGCSFMGKKAADFRTETSLSRIWVWAGHKDLQNLKTKRTELPRKRHLRKICWIHEQSSILNM